MNKRIVVNNGDGTVAIVAAALGEDVFSGSYTDYVIECELRGLRCDFQKDEFEESNRYSAYLEKVAELLVPDGVTSRATDVSNIPSDRTFRGAWSDANPTETVDVDMPRARVIQMDRIRGKRDEKWGDLDQAYMLCDEQADAPGKSAIAAQKQVLRDIPTTFDLESITDPDILKDTWPPEVL